MDDRTVRVECLDCEFEQETFGVGQMPGSVLHSHARETGHELRMVTDA